jgi:signal transduction histidine kinase
VTGFDPETRKEIVLAARYNSAGYLSEQPWQEISPGSGTAPTADQVALNLPLYAGNNLVGYLSLGMNEPGKFRPDCLEIAREMAAQLAIGIQHAYLFEEVNQTQQRLKALSSSLLKAQEMERRRIARELHDEIGQAITALKISLQNLQAIPQPTEVRNQLEDSISIAHLTLQQVRALALELRPSMLDDLGLVAALRWYLDRVSNRAGLALHFTVDSEFSERLPSEIETVCFRLVQEALTNIIRHARAEEVWVDLKIDRDTFFVSVKDDGVGFNVKEALEKGVNGSSMGLQGMLERVNLVKGDLKFTSSPQQGSFISAQFPVIKQKLTSTAAEL